MELLESDAKVVQLLRAAARELHPVVLEIGPERIWFSSFITAVEERNGAFAVLDPIADALPQVTGHFRITSAGGADWFVVADRLERDGPARVRIGLEGARAFEVEQHASVAVPTTELLVMVVPGGLHGSSAYIFPVQRIGADVCEIRSSVALEVGRQLGRVEIVGDRRLLRRASAQVLDTVAWYLPDGSASFCCRLSLNEEHDDPDDRSHDLVIDAAEVRRLLELAGFMSANGWYEAPGSSRGSLRFQEISRDSVRLELARTPEGELTTLPSIRIGVELFAVAYEFDVRVVAVEGSRLVTSVPLILKRRRRHRRDHRVPVASPHTVSVSYRNPITGTTERRPVADLSFFGLSFDDPSAAALFWPGLPLEQAQLHWRGRLIPLGDLTVERITRSPPSDGSRCAVSIPSTAVADDLDMIGLITALAHPNVRTHDGGDFSALLNTYLNAGLFGPHMERNLEPILEQTKRVWHSMHRGASDVARTFVHGPEDAPDASVTVLRAWEHAWVAQHFVDTSPEFTGASGKLQNAYIDYLVPRPDGRYLVFFIKTDNQIMNSYVRRFIESTGTPEAATRRTVELWLRPPQAVRRSTSHADIAVRAVTPDDEIVVARAAQRCYSAEAAAALSMLPGELDIPDTRARFARAGLERSRDCAIVTRGAERVYAVIEERATPGLNLTWMLNASWIIPIHGDLDRDGACFDAALQHAIDKPAQSMIGEHFLNVPEGIDPQPLQSWGFVKEASLYFYALTRAGLHRWLHYTARRYGELDALAARRERRRGRRSP